MSARLRLPVSKPRGKRAAASAGGSDKADQEEEEEGLPVAPGPAKKKIQQGSCKCGLCSGLSKDSFTYSIQP